MKKTILLMISIFILASCNDGILFNQINSKTDKVINGGKSSDPDPEDIYVSTEPQKRCAIIEEYTGINCGYCPDGHRIVNEIMAAYPGQVFGVNIHQGGYADNTYTTTEGNSYGKEANIEGYPSGCINRHDFSGKMVIFREYFETYTQSILAMASPVNINATARIDQSTRLLTVKVRGYFTSEQSVTSNSLYVFILQDSVMGSQVDIGNPSYNPDQWVGNQYRHMHMFRTNVTGIWGDQIQPLTAGTYFSKEYTYSIPAQLGIKGINAVLKDLRILVFIAEGHKEILTVMSPDVELK